MQHPQAGVRVGDDRKRKDDAQGPGDTVREHGGLLGCSWATGAAKYAPRRAPPGLQRCTHHRVPAWLASIDVPRSQLHGPRRGAVALLACTSCALQPPKPVVPEVPAAFDGGAGGGPASWPGKDWYRGFHSAALDALVAQAANSNLDLAAAIARVAQADQRARQAGAAILPSVDALGNGNFLAGHSRADSAHELDWSALLSASYEVDFWGRNRATANAHVSWAVPPVPTGHVRPDHARRRGRRLFRTAVAAGAAAHCAVESRCGTRAARDGAGAVRCGARRIRSSWLRSAPYWPQPNWRYRSCGSVPARR